MHRLIFNKTRRGPLQLALVSLYYFFLFALLAKMLLLRNIKVGRSSLKSKRFSCNGKLKKPPCQCFEDDINEQINQLVLVSSSPTCVLCGLKFLELSTTSSLTHFNKWAILEPVTHYLTKMLS